MWDFLKIFIYLFIYLATSGLRFGSCMLHVGSFFVALGLSFLAVKLGSLLRHSSSGACRLSSCSTQAQLAHGMWEY